MKGEFETIDEWMEKTIQKYLKIIALERMKGFEKRIKKIIEVKKR